ADWLGFFNSEEKFDYAYSVEKQDGWFSPEVSETAKGATLKDIKEYFHIYPWGRVPGKLKADADRYYGIANKLARELLSWVQQYTPADIAANYREPLSHMIEGSQQTLLLVLRYPPLTGNEPAGSLRAAAHGDINLLTILPAANEPGLQVQDKNGDWIDVP
ncbi:isopenicillin N synthase family oxygenase, partial [Pseudomonas sp. MWU12-2534b]